MGQDTITEARPALMNMIFGSMASQVASACVRLGVADALGEAELSTPEVASTCGTPVGTTRRLLRAATALGLAVDRGGDRFALTPMGAMLRSGGEGSPHTFARVFTDPVMVRPWHRLDEAVTGDRTTFEDEFGVPFFDHLKTAPDLAASPDGSVVGIVATEAPALHGIDLRTSTPLWTVRDGDVTALCATTDRNGRTIVLYADSRNEIHAIDAATGTWVRRRIGTRWAARITADRTRFISAWPGGELFVVTGTSMVVWDLEVGGPITSPTEGAATGHAPVCGTTPDGIRWIATTRGTLVRYRRLDLPVRDDPPPSARGDVAGAEGSVDFAPSAHLTLAWEADLELPITALAVDSDGSFLVGTRRGMVRLRSSPATPGQSRTPRPARAPEGEALSTGPVVFTRRV